MAVEESAPGLSLEGRRAGPIGGPDGPGGLGRDRHALTTSGLRPLAVSVSVAGPAHGDGRCEDASDTRIIGDRVIVAMSDGLGSVPGGGQGASLAVAAAIEASEVCLLTDPTAALDEVAMIMVSAARRALEDAPGQTAGYACTFIACASEGAAIATAHIGDGAVVALTPEGELVVVSPPSDSEYVNEVEHLAQPHWQDSLRIRIHEPITGFMTFTDGLQRAALKRMDGSWSGFEGFVKPIFEHVRSSLAIESVYSELSALLSGERLSDHSEDDKSLAVALLD